MFLADVKMSCCLLQDFVFMVSVREIIHFPIVLTSYHAQHSRSSFENKGSNKQYIYINTLKLFLSGYRTDNELKCKYVVALAEYSQMYICIYQSMSSHESDL